MSTAVRPDPSSAPSSPPRPSPAAVPPSLPAPAFTTGHRPGSAAPRPRVRPAAYAVTGGLATVSAVTCALTFFVDGIVPAPAVMVGSARGTALVLLVVGLPLLVAAAVATRRAGPAVARGAFVIWVGLTGYVLYNALMFLLGAHFGSLFLLYEAMLSLSVAGLVTLLAGLDPAAVAAGEEHVRHRLVASWMGFVAVGNALVWLRQVVPALADPRHAPFLDGTGLTVLPTHLQDLAFWLPLAGVLAVAVWRRTAWGWVLGSALLVYWQVEAIGVAVDQWMGSHADPSSAVATMGGAWLFAVLAVVGVVPLAAMLRPHDTRVDQAPEDDAAAVRT